MKRTAQHDSEERVRDMPGPGPRQAQGLSTWRVVVILLLALACVGTGLLARTALEASTREDRRQDALEVAEKAAVAILSSDHARLDEDVEAARAFLTPSFAREYAEYTGSTVEPRARRYRAVLTTEVLASGLETIEGEEATALLYLNQTTRSSQLVAPRLDVSTVEIRLVWTDGQWLVAGVEPI